MKKSLHPAKSTYIYCVTNSNAVLLRQHGPGDEGFVFGSHILLKVLETGLAVLTPVHSNRQVGMEWDQLVLENALLELTQIVVLIPYHSRQTCSTENENN